MQRLGPGVVDDQYPIGFVEAQAAEGLDLFQHAGGVQGAGEEFLAAGAGCGQAGRGVGLAVAEEQHRQLVFEAGLGLAGQSQAHVGAGEVDFHDDRRRVAFAHAGAEGVGGLAAQRLQTEELQLLGQALGAFAVLQCQVDRFAQWRQDGVLELVAMPQAGARQALHQLVEFADRLAGKPAAVGLDDVQGAVDGTGQLGMLGLLEAFGIALQAQGGVGQFFHAVAVPLRAGQALPDLQNLARLVDHSLGEVVLQAVQGRVIVLGHHDALLSWSSRQSVAANDGSMLSPIAMKASGRWAADERSLFFSKCHPHLLVGAFVRRTTACLCLFRKILTEHSGTKPASTTLKADDAEVFGVLEGLALGTERVRHGPIPHLSSCFKDPCHAGLEEASWDHARSRGQFRG